MPYGVVGSFAGSVMPYLTRNAGVEVESIGWYGTLLFIPPMLQFLYAPIVDVGPKRKHWLVIVAALGAAFLVGACVMPLPEHMTAFLAFAVAAQLISGLVGACNGGLLAVTMPDDLRGRAGAWYNVGNLSGGALAAWVAISMTSAELDPLVIGLTLAAMMVLPSLVILWVHEPPRDNIATAREVFSTTLRDVKTVLFSKTGITGVLLCLSPVGTASLMNYFTAFGPDYDASPFLVGITSGPAQAVLTATGALAGGYLCDRYNRRAMYLLAGTLTALVGIAMMLSPRTEVTFAWGVMTYMLVTGFCYSAFTATVLETIGKGGKAASTQYSLFVAAGNAAIAYVGFIDTRFHKKHGVEGVIASDAALNLAGVVVLGLVFWRMGVFAKRRLTGANDEADRDDSAQSR
ncbi:MAG: major facilitator superfamily 1 [Myxococcales bacterium]|nr:major facilitator superfamily 1 [Myxococcales bacterium]